MDPVNSSNNRINPIDDSPYATPPGSHQAADLNSKISDQASAIFKKLNFSDHEALTKSIKLLSPNESKIFIKALGMIKNELSLDSDYSQVFFQKLNLIIESSHIDPLLEEAAEILAKYEITDANSLVNLKGMTLEEGKTVNRALDLINNAKIFAKKPSLDPDSSQAFLQKLNLIVESSHIDPLLKEAAEILAKYEITNTNSLTHLKGMTLEEGKTVSRALDFINNTKVFAKKPSLDPDSSQAFLQKLNLIVESSHIDPLLKEAAEILAKYEITDANSLSHLKGMTLEEGKTVDRALDFINKSKIF